MAEIAQLVRDEASGAEAETQGRDVGGSGYHFFHPATGLVRVKGVTQSTNAILHPWVKEQIREITHCQKSRCWMKQRTVRCGSRITAKGSRPEQRISTRWREMLDCAVYWLNLIVEAMEFSQVFPIV